MAPPSKSVPQKDAPQVDARADRLAAALRENLKRRKARARAQAGGQVAKRDPAEPVDTDRSDG
jgi:hypothetical protein